MPALWCLLPYVLALDPLILLTTTNLGNYLPAFLPAFLTRFILDVFVYRSYSWRR